MATKPFDETLSLFSFVSPDIELWSDSEPLAEYIAKGVVCAGQVVRDKLVEPRGYYNIMLPVKNNEEHQYYIQVHRTSDLYGLDIFAGPLGDTKEKTVSIV